jgi:hypothetical protein
VRAGRAGHRCTYFFFVALLVLFALATLTVHLNQLGVLALPAWPGIQIALDAPGRQARLSRGKAVDSGGQRPRLHA